MPGHTGLEGNESADRLAGETSEESQERVGIDMANARAAVARHVHELSCLRAAAAHPHPAPTPDYDDLTRWESVTVSQLRRGKSSAQSSAGTLKFGRAADEK